MYHKHLFVYKMDEVPVTLATAFPLSLNLTLSITCRLGAVTHWFVNIYIG